MQQNERVQQLERVQRGRSVCSEVEACAARSERVQRGRSVCSEVGACAARLERVQRGLAKKKIIKSKVSPHYRYNFILLRRNMGIFIGVGVL